MKGKELGFCGATSLAQNDDSYGYAWTSRQEVGRGNFLSSTPGFTQARTKVDVIASVWGCVTGLEEPGPRFEFEALKPPSMFLALKYHRHVTPGD
jgi:hypothetical protein